MTALDKSTRTALVREIALTLAKKQRLAFASDFHVFAEGRRLVLAGVSFDNFPKGPNTRRSDGDVVAHAIVMALAAAVNKGDIDDWFPDKGETDVRSIDYLPEMQRRLIAPDHLILSTVDVTILCGEQPRMKKRLSEMQRNIAEGLGIDLNQVHVKVSSMDGQREYHFKVGQGCIESQSPTGKADAVLHIVLCVDNFSNSVKLTNTSKLLLTRCINAGLNLVSPSTVRPPCKRGTPVLRSSRISTGTAISLSKYSCPLLQRPLIDLYQNLCHNCVEYA